MVQNTFKILCHIPEKLFKVLADKVFKKVNSFIDACCRVIIFIIIREFSPQQLFQTRWSLGNSFKIYNR